MLAILIQLILPILMIIGMGACYRIKGLCEASFPDDLMLLVFRVIMPITLFLDMSRLDLSHQFNSGFMLAYLVTSLVMMMLAWFAFKTIFSKNKSVCFLRAIAATHTNTAFIALPIFLLTFGTSLPVILVIAIQNIFLLGYLFYLDKQSMSSSSWYTPLQNPLLIGSALGFVFHLTHLNLPQVINQTFEWISKSTAFLALFSLGGSLYQSNVKLSQHFSKDMMLSLFLKTTIHPLLAYFIGKNLFHLKGFWLESLVLISAMPTAKLVFLLAKKYKIDQTFANWTVLLSTILTFIPISLILAIISR
jgi:malonate transporter and related proteins